MRPSTIGAIFTTMILMAHEMHAATRVCDARVTNRRYHVQIDTDTLLMSSTSDHNFEHRGYSVYHFSPRVRYKTYTLPGSFYNSPLTLLIDPEQNDSMSLCFNQSECYPCS